MIQRAVAAHRSLRLLVAVGVVFVALAAAPARVRAENAAVRQPRVQWSPLWPKFRWWEYGGTAALDVGNYLLYYHTTPPEHPKWQGGNAFDNAIRNWLRADTADGRADAARFSDLLTLSRYIVPFGVDLPIVLLVHRQVGVTWQLLMMDLEAFAVAGFINNVLFYEAGRGRPDAADCAQNPQYDPLCNVGNNASFPSGHTLGVATAAGLMCVHHRYLPIYGHAAADASGCVLMSLAAVATGVARIMSDRHFASDVLIGGTIGFTSGYGLPWLLHYRGGSGGADAEAPGPMFSILPLAAPRTVGIGLVGVL
jgi:membrane-associated phospholipid phosphatase